MKKTLPREVIFCDVCEKDCGTYAPYTCLGCGKDYCFDCGYEGVQALVKYNRGVFSGGTGDGNYCKDCDEKLSAAHDPLHEAYQAVKRLTDEHRNKHGDFKHRCDAAEARLDELLAARR